MEEIEVQVPAILTQSTSGRRRSSVSNSPEFEFWMVRNPSVPQPDLLSADELFSHGVLLPLGHVPQDHRPSSDDPSDQTSTISPAYPSRNSGSDGPDISHAAVSSSAFSVVSTSKRWKDIFKKGEKKNSKGGIEEKEKKEKKGVAVGTSGVTAAELNINIWPFSRSRSAGNGGTRPRVGAGSGSVHRKVSSAPCSRSNSAGESKSRKWPTSPTRPGVHLGRSSPVWQMRRSGGASSRSIDNPPKSAEKTVKRDGDADKTVKINKNVWKGVKKEGNDVRRENSPAARSGVVNGVRKARALNLNVPMCIGYRTHLSCRSEESNTLAAAAAAASDGDCSGGVPSETVRSSSNLFVLRNLFTKKVQYIK
ncbi:unnamed protein product [Cuscuta europaea]|uniref:Uncharacterized protein n=1 Tax=Cuscuta europaea TaxID=41803 RepID=A0A9P0Z0F8_CUSEU|nr:unnamed protein product [Cuscuta europaea]